MIKTLPPFALLLALLVLPACDSNEEDPGFGGNLYELRVEGTEDLLFSCTITLISPSDTASATFEGLNVPDEALLGFANGAGVECTKLEEPGLMRLRLFRNGLVADTDETEEPFGKANVSDNLSEP